MFYMKIVLLDILSRISMPCLFHKVSPNKIYMYVYIHIHTYMHAYMFVVVKFDDLPQASDFRTERIQVVFLC